MRIKGIVFLIIAVVLLAGLFALLKPRNDSVDNGDLLVKQGATTTPSNNIVFDIVVQNKKIVSGGNTLQAIEGDTVTMNLTVDEGGEVHLHGYNKMVELQKNVQGSIVFTANLTGRFPFELEDSKTDLGVLEVQPKN